MIYLDHNATSPLRASARLAVANALPMTCALRNLKCSSIGWPEKPSLPVTLMPSCLVCTPWNVPLWWQFRRLRYAIEVDCDASVLRSGGDARQYGETLLAVGQRQATSITTVAAMSSPAAANMPTIRPEFSQSSRSPWSSAP